MISATGVYSSKPVKHSSCLTSSKLLRGDMRANDGEGNQRNGFHTHTRNNVRIWIYALIHAYDIWYMILWLASGHSMLSASIASDDINPRWISQNKLYCILNQPGNSPRFLFWKVAKRPKKQLSFHFPSVLWPWRHCLEQAGQPKGWGGWRPSSLMKLPVVFNEKKKNAEKRQNSGVDLRRCKMLRSWKSSVGDVYGKIS